MTKRNNAPPPRPDEMFDGLGDASFFSKLDLKTGFHHIRVNPDDVEKTAFNTKYGQFEYLVMPMGLCNAPATFQTLMNRIFRDCIDVFMVVYMGDLLVFSQTRETHLEHLQILLERLRSEQLYLSPRKCSFTQEETAFLGMVVGRKGIWINPDKAKVVHTWPKPWTVRELRSFIGLLQFFRRLIMEFSGIAAPLTNLTRKDSTIHEWDASCDAAFASLKSAITSAPILVAPDWTRKLRCHVDASQLAVGGTLTQHCAAGAERVVSYFSKKISDTEQDYTANERELLGLVYFLKRFRCYFEGSSFEVITDNQELNHFFIKPHMSRKEARWLDLLSQFGIKEVTLQPGRVHVLGDVLSRAPHVIDGLEVANMQVSTVSFDLGFEAQYASD